MQLVVLVEADTAWAYLPVKRMSRIKIYTVIEHWKDKLSLQVVNANIFKMLSIKIRCNSIYIGRENNKSPPPSSVTRFICSIRVNNPEALCFL